MEDGRPPTLSSYPPRAEPADKDLPIDPFTLVSEQSLREIETRLSSIEQALLKILSQSEIRLTPGTLPLPQPVREAPDPMWIPVIHKVVHHPDDPAHEGGCGNPALYLTRPFTTHERADISALRVCFPGELQWREPKPGDVSLCSSCGRPISPWSDRDLDYAAVLLPDPEPVKVTVPRKRRRKTPADLVTPEASTEMATTLDAISQLATQAGIGLDARP